MSPYAPVRKATVWLSRRCQCIYHNLALEDWIFRRHSFADQDGLLIWRNRPAAVIGRHQNPWAEVNVPFAVDNGIDVVRRQSGGGAVYHDLGNVNICIFTSKARHKREENMKLLAKVLKDRWNIDSEVSKRHDLLLDGKYKISGTAAKLTHDKAYHHFTLMLHVDVETLWAVLSPSMAGVSSKATTSTRSEVKTLADVAKGVEYEAAVKAIVEEFQSRYEVSDLIEIDEITNAHFENVEANVMEFSSRRWTYGLTPPFTVSSTIADGAVSVCLHVEKGILVRFTINRTNATLAGPSDLQDVLNASSYIGETFDPELCARIFDWVHCLLPQCRALP